MRVATLFLLACTECRTMAATLDCAMLLSKPNASCHPVASLGAYRGIPHPSLPSGVYRLLAFRFFFLSCIHIALKCLPSLQQAPFPGGRSCRDCCLPCPFPTSGGGWEKKLGKGGAAARFGLEPKRYSVILTRGGGGARNDSRQATSDTYISSVGLR